jgi:soluble lytic murein transglycosylase-like protein
VQQHNIDVALQHFPLIADTFRQFIAVLHLSTAVGGSIGPSQQWLMRPRLQERKGPSMKKSIVAGLLAAGLSAAVFAIPAEARCESSDCAPFATKQTQKVNWTSTTRRVAQTRVRHRSALVVPKHRAHVVAMIESMAPQYGVPTWFALRIAKVESGYNPNARGRAGELGVFQLKCATARGLGYRGNCSGLLNARTGVQYGLKHLSVALKSSGGNLRLAASKHNGGLDRKSLVPKYVALVF